MKSGYMSYISEEKAQKIESWYVNEFVEKNNRWFDFDHEDVVVVNYKPESVYSKDTIEFWKSVPGLGWFGRWLQRKTKQKTETYRFPCYATEKGGEIEFRHSKSLINFIKQLRRKVS